MRRLPPFLLAAVVVALAALAPTLCAQASNPTMNLEAGPVLTLDDAIGLALKHNKNLIVSSFGRGISRGNLLAARGQFDPSIQATRIGSNSPGQLSPDPTQISIVPPFNYRQDNYTLALTGQTPFGTSYQVGGSAINQRYSFYGFQNDYTTYAGFQITQHLLKGFGFDANLVNVRIAKANRGISDWAYKQSAITTVTNVIVGYSNLLLAHDQLNAARKTHDLAAALLAGNEKEYKVGSISQSDVIAARANLAQLDEPILIAERAVRDSQDALRELIGDEVFLDDEALFILVPPPISDVAVDLKADIARALTMRPDYQQARLGIVQNRATEAAARNALLPQVDFVGGYGYNGFGNTFATSRAMLEERNTPSYSAGLQVTIPLTFSVGRGNFRAARLQREMNEEDLKRREADIAVAVAQAAGQIETTRRRVEADRIAYDLATKALEAQQKKKLAGTSTTLEVIQQQQSVSLAESNISSALAAQRQAAALYDQAVGTTLDRNHINLATE
ncbi:MAG TPA: TolC family protein [Opitutaceae bacterium]|jgi:outer membrane protein TolC